MPKSKKSEKSSFIKKIGSAKPPELNLAKETKRGIAVVIFVAFSVLCAITLFYPAGTLGVYLRNLLVWGFGVISYLVPVLFLLVAAALGKEDLKTEGSNHFYARSIIGVILLAGSTAGLIHMVYMTPDLTAFILAGEGKAGGYLGALFAGPAAALLGGVMGTIVLVALLIIAILITFNIPLHFLSLLRYFSKQNKLPDPKLDLKINAFNDAESQGFVKETVQTKPKAPESAPKPPKIDEIDLSKLGAFIVEDRKDWKLPPFDLLDDNKQKVDSGNIEANCQVIKKTLSDFGIRVEMGEVSIGPTVTQYTFKPADGVKLSQIASLEDNLALALAARSIRMELPIPGKALVGVEIPNVVNAVVRLRDCIEAQDFISSKSNLTLAVGRDVAGKNILADLAGMPHLLVAGATGTGKSVCINSLLLSLLYRNTPQDVKFILVDPKRVELNLYNGIPHLLTPPILDSDKAINALKWAVNEMDRRYRLFSESNKRNISEFNTATQNKLPYIVIIVDELADLMSIAKVDVEKAIVRLAQLARAVGIHLILATQRPSVDVITGLIKANITTRFAFKTGSQVDSRTIIDFAGAEGLLGKGDMLIKSSDYPAPKRVQAAFVDEKEVKRVVDFLRQQAGAVIYSEEVTEKPRPGGANSHSGTEEDDPMFEQAVEQVKLAGKASTSFLQRRLGLGYNRAARIIDIMEERGIVGPANGSKQREVYGVSPQEKAEYGIEDQPDDTM